MTDYPEHERLRTISSLSQKVGEFLAWLRYTKSCYLAYYPMLCRHQDRSGKCLEDLQEAEACPRDCEMREMEHADTLELFYYKTTTLLAEFFSIDPDRLEEEKRQMLEELQ